MSGITGKGWYAVAYMFLLTALFSSVLIGFSRATRKQVEANQQLTLEKAVLTVLPLEIPPGASNLQIHELYVQQVTLPSPETAGAYTLRKDGKITAYAVPFAGQGFWAPIRGVMGIADDQRTILGVVFYEQSETPGLGAQITTTEFRSQFVGKTLSSAGPAIGIRPISESLGENQVHAVTGATQTSTRLEKLMNQGLQTWRDAMKQGGS